MFTCPVCYYPGMREAPADYNICECCGTEFGNDDESQTHAELRAGWMAAGGPWFFKTAPHGWNPWTQLYGAYVAQVPFAAPIAYYGGGVSFTEQSLDPKY